MIKVIFYKPIKILFRIIRLLLMTTAKIIIYFLDRPVEIQGKPKVNYHTYIQSPEWKAKGKIFKKKVGNRCQVFPWIKLKTYAVHHCTYKNLGSEKWNIDCIVLSKTAHAIVHSWLVGSIYPIGVSEQDKKGRNTKFSLARPQMSKIQSIYTKFLSIIYVVYNHPIWYKYPNLFQRVFHFYARLVGLFLYLLR
ncbi:hypothetical protein [Okeania sp. SIO2C9]|uniref:hypothetical protein n=1 Tax=Okeania sp. SIO2C9 TaxID=2607791 RepID=UPI0025F7970F|nr:hypothetical protein [Okeania sp. SIO2C9]